MADTDSVRQRIISSVFSKRNASGVEESYVSHVKIWEDAGVEEGGRKPRYILLSQASNGAGFIHKSKLNANGSFSVGKTWRLQELRGVEVVNPLAFNVTFARTYRWQTESQADQANFVASLIRLFRSIISGSVPLQIIGVRDPDTPSTSKTPSLPLQQGLTRMERAPTPPNGVPLQPIPARRPYANGYGDTSRTSNFSIRSASPTLIPPTPRAASRPRRTASPTSSRPQTPDGPSRAVPPTPTPERAATPSRARPTTPSSQQQPPPVPSALRPRQGRRPSNASSSMRASASTTSSQIPSIVVPSTSVPLRPSITTPPITINTTLSKPLGVNGSMKAPSSALDVPVSSSASSSLVAPSPLSAYHSTPDTPRPRNISPAPSTRSRKYSTGPSSVTQSSSTQAPTRREQNTRVSFYDPANQATLDRLISGDAMLQLDKDTEGEGDGGEVETESAQATLTSVEEMLEGYEWGGDDVLGGGATRGTADQIEARLLDELMALEKANIHSFIESDDRIGIVLRYLDDAIAELDSMDSIVASYKIHLNAVNDDIGFIQSQRRGLQVQTQNQRALLGELERLLQNVNVEQRALLMLTQESLERAPSIPKIEEAATQLYKALQASRDRDMAATMERLDEYKTHNAQFCKRILDYLSIQFTFQSQELLRDGNGVVRPARGRPYLKDHKDFENIIGKYGGLMLYLKEMDEVIYAKLCAAYFSSSSDLHRGQVTAFLSACNSMIKKSADEDDGFGGPTPTTGTYRAAAGMRRAGTIVRSPLEGRREKKEQADGDMRASDAFGLVLEQIAPMVYREEDFIADFLQINDAALTFADYMGLDNYFRRQAARAPGPTGSTLKLVRGALDLIFGFLPAELKSWLDNALGKDHIQIIGIIVCLERFLADAEERGNTFFLNVLEKQHSRLRSLFDRRVNEHIKSVEETKLTSKRRNGVAPFIKYFPTYVGRVENQLIGADTLEIRQHVDQSYDKIVQTMFDSLKQMAKMDGEGEDKGQLNYHVILIENMHHFVAEISRLDIGAVAQFLKRAETIYDENLSAYVKIVLRRPFSKIIDYFEGVERLLKTTAPSEVSSNSSYNKSALKKVVKEFTAKDVRKHVDALFKRVEKHFTEASEKATTEDVNASIGIASGTVMVGVWKACEEELLRITELFSKRIAQCYQTTGVTLEYTAPDVESAFKRHRIIS